MKKPSIDIIKCILILICISPSFARAAVKDEEPIPFLDVFKKIPKSSETAARKAFNKDALPYWGIILGTTATTYYYDEKISASARYHAHNWHINPHYRTHHSFETKGNLLNMPRDIGSMLYFCGDGFIHLAAATTFIAAGKITESNYTANTGMMMLHGLTMTGLYSQLLKRSFGRESPVEKTQDRGTFHPFPSFHKYQSNTAKYDAMPSGHIMTATLTFTILANRYEEYAVPIWTVGGLWIGSLGFQMLNNGVHWASDYPLGIGMGYLIGRSVIQMQTPKKNEAKNETSWIFYPGINNGAPSMNAIALF